MKYLMKPQSRKVLEQHFPDRPHPLIATAKYFEFTVYNQPVGYIGLSHGVSHRNLLPTLFDCELTVDDYWEIVRSYCRQKYKNMPSKMLSIILKLLKKHTKKKFVYTTGAGYQGLTGRIYQAANFLYIGKFMTRIFYLPGVGYLHTRSFGDRYHTCNYKKLLKIYPTLKVRIAPVFRYIYFLKDKEQLMKHAKFEALPYPERESIVIKEIDAHSSRYITYKEAYDKIASLKSNSRFYTGFLCVNGEKSITSDSQSEVGGASPTLTLQKRYKAIYNKYSLL